MALDTDIEMSGVSSVRGQASCLAEELRPVMETHDIPPYCIVSSWYIENPNDPERQIQIAVSQIASALSNLGDKHFDAVVSSLDPTDRLFLDNEYTANRPGDRLHRLAALLLGEYVRGTWLSPGRAISEDNDTSPVLSAFPELRENIDDEGLFRLTPSDCTTPYGLTHKGHLILFHPFLRQHFRGRFNEQLLFALLQDLRVADDASTIRIALDLQRYLPVEQFNPIRERDFWYGPRFSREDLDDPRAVGRAVHIRTRPSFFDLICPLDRTEFYSRLEKDERTKSIEIEEVKPVSATDDALILNRYLHAERDTRAQMFRHCDGAVKVYRTSEYQARYDSEIPREPRARRKVKLFRVDGTITTERWLTLTGHFFDDNEHVLEHFDPELFEEIFGERARRYHALKSGPSEQPT